MTDIILLCIAYPFIKTCKISITAENKPTSLGTFNLNLEDLINNIFIRIGQISSLQ